MKAAAFLLLLLFLCFPRMDVSAAGVDFDKTYLDSNGFFIGGGHYYEQLTQIQKDTYRILLKEVCEFGSGFDVFCGTWDNLWAAYLAVYYDHTEIWWLARDCDSSPATGVVPGYLFSASQFASAQAAIDSKVASIVRNCPSGNDYQKLRYVFQWLVLNVKYDFGDYDQTMYSTFVQGKTVCAGYARGMEYILGKMGIESFYVRGFTNAEEHGYHAWCLVKLGNDWYHSDPTWGDPDDGTVDWDFVACTQADINRLHRGGSLEGYFLSQNNSCMVPSNYPVATATNPNVSCGSITKYRVSGAATNGSLSGVGSYNKGSTVNVSYAPLSGFNLWTVRVNGMSMDHTDFRSGFTLSNLQHDYKVEIGFRPVGEIRVEAIGRLSTDGNMEPVASGRPGAVFECSAEYTNSKLNSVLCNPSMTVRLPSGLSLQGEPTVFPSELFYRVTVSADRKTFTLMPKDSGLEMTATGLYDMDLRFNVVHDGQTLGDLPVTVTAASSDVPSKTATFTARIEGWKVTTSVSHGTVTPPVTGIKNGESKTVQYAPEDGYYVKSVVADGEAVEANMRGGSYTFQDIRGDHTFSVVCEKLHRVDVSIDHGVISGGSDRLFPGDDCQVTYSPDEGYYVKSVTVDGAKLSGSAVKPYLSSHLFQDVHGDHSIHVECVVVPELKVSFTGSGFQALGDAGSITVQLRLSGTDYLGDSYVFYRQADLSGGTAVVRSRFPAGVYEVSVLPVHGIQAVPGTPVVLDTRESDLAEGALLFKPTFKHYGYWHYDGSVTAIH